MVHLVKRKMPERRTKRVEGVQMAQVNTSIILNTCKFVILTKDENHIL